MLLNPVALSAIEETLNDAPAQVAKDKEKLLPPFTLCLLGSHLIALKIQHPHLLHTEHRETLISIEKRTSEIANLLNSTIELIKYPYKHRSIRQCFPYTYNFFHLAPGAQDASAITASIEAMAYTSSSYFGITYYNGQPRQGITEQEIITNLGYWLKNFSDYFFIHQPGDAETDIASLGDNDRRIRQSSIAFKLCSYMEEPPVAELLQQVKNMATLPQGYFREGAGYIANIQNSCIQICIRMFDNSDPFTTVEEKNSLQSSVHMLRQIIKDKFAHNDNREIDPDFL